MNTGSKLPTFPVAQDPTPEAMAAILDSISDGFFALDDDFVVTWFNKAAEKLLGRTSDEVLGRPLLDAFPEARGSVFEERYAQAIRDKVPLSFEVYFGTPPYENWYDVRVYPQKNGISVFFQVTTERKRVEAEREKLIAELQDALARVKTLSGFIPICSGCKKIRNDKGYWHSVEQYVKDHTDAEFSHGLCPDCLERLYPEYPTSGK